MQRQVYCRVSVPSFPLLSTGGNFQSQILKREGQKKSTWGGGGGLKEFLPWIFACGLTFLIKKRLLKIQYGFEGSISNVDLGMC